MNALNNQNAYLVLYLSQKASIVVLHIDANWYEATRSVEVHNEKKPLILYLPVFSLFEYAINKYLSHCSTSDT